MSDNPTYREFVRHAGKYLKHPGVYMFGDFEVIVRHKSEENMSDNKEYNDVSDKIKEAKEFVQRIPTKTSAAVKEATYSCGHKREVYFRCPTCGTT